MIGFPELGTPPRGIGYTVGSTLTHPDFRFNPHRAAFDVSPASFILFGWLMDYHSPLCAFSIFVNGDGGKVETIRQSTRRRGGKVQEEKAQYQVWQSIK